MTHGYPWFPFYLLHHAALNYATNLILGSSSHRSSTQLDAPPIRDATRLDQMWYESASVSFLRFQRHHTYLRGFFVEIMHFIPLRYLAKSPVSILDERLDSAVESYPYPSI